MSAKSKEGPSDPYFSIKENIHFAFVLSYLQFITKYVY